MFIWKEYGQSLFTAKARSRWDGSSIKRTSLDNALQSHDLTTLVSATTVLCTRYTSTLTMPQVTIKIEIHTLGFMSLSTTFEGTSNIA
jgi:hypothetical protein